MNRRSPIGVTALRFGLSVCLAGGVVAGLFEADRVARAQQIIEVRPAPTTDRLLTPRLTDWRLTGPATLRSPVEFERDEPDRAPLIREYGLREMASGIYSGAQKEQVRIEIFRMIHYVAAYGAFSMERHAEAKRVAVGTEGAQEADRLGFYKGEYYARLSVIQGVVRSDILLALAQELDRKLGDRPSEIPLLVQHLPSIDLVSGTERFIAGPLGLERFRQSGDQQDVFMLSSEGAEAVLAEYRSGRETSRLMIVEYHTPQLAAAAYRQVDRYFQSLPEDERQRRILKREGNYLIEATEVHDRAAMQQIVDRIKYNPAIQWLGKNPFEYLRGLRGVPQFSTTQWLLATFGFIGIGLLIAFAAGVIMGTLTFLWRRRRFRYSGQFTDAGGMLRLNLDQLVLPPVKERAQKRLPGS